MNDIVCDWDGNGNRDKDGDAMIKTKDYLHNLIEMISNIMSNIIAITKTVMRCRPMHYKYIYKRLAFISIATSRYVYPQT